MEFFQRIELLTRADKFDRFIGHHANGERCPGEFRQCQRRGQPEPVPGQVDQNRHGGRFPKGELYDD